MTIVDYGILIFIAISALIGVVRGLVREIFALVVWVAALLLAWLFHREASDLLLPYVQQPSLRLILAWLGLVLLILICGSLLSALLTIIVNKIGLSGLNRFLGSFFGAARGVVVVAVLVYLAAMTPLVEDPWWHESQLIPHFQAVAQWIIKLIPADLQQQLRQL